MTQTASSCNVCGRDFQVRFAYQVREEAGRFAYVCSTACHERLLAQEGQCTCSTCGKSFALEFPYQVRVSEGARRYFCSLGCRKESVPQIKAAPPPVARKTPRRIAVFNHKGGTGKTTTAVNLAAAAAESGAKVLLIDADGQGNVGASLGIRGEQTLYHVLVLGADPLGAVVPIRNNLDVLTSNETLAAAELYLARQPNRDRILRDRLGVCAESYDLVVIDCAPALSLMNQNALVYADSVLVPVACDYLSLFGVRQVLKTLRNVRELLRHEVSFLGVLPTFYDARQRIARQSVDALREHFKERCLAPIRANTKIKEAPTAKQTIFEYAADSHGAQDYRALFRRVQRELEGKQNNASSLLEPMLEEMTSKSEQGAMMPVPAYAASAARGSR